MPRQLIIAAFALLALAWPARATTLLKLSLDQMIDQSTAIVRGSVLSCQGEARGGMIHTVCGFSVMERLKGVPNVDRFSVPGGALQVNGKRMRQMVAGTPSFAAGQEYVLFLWTSPKGVTELIGLSQGVLEVKQAIGTRVATRAAVNEVTLVDAAGHEVTDEGLTISLGDLRKRVQARQGASR